MRKINVMALGAFFVISASLCLEASGIRPFELSARAASLGGAFAARTDDSSAVFYNPAALSFSQGLMVKLNLYYPRTVLTSEYPDISTSASSTVEKINGSTFISLNIKERFGLGIGIFFPQSMGANWPYNWAGHELTIRSKWNTFYFRPVVSVKITKFLSVGVGMDIISSDVNWTHDRILTPKEMGTGAQLFTDCESIVSAKGIGYVAGALIRLTDNLQFGGRFQPEVKLDFSGSQSFIMRLGYELPYGILLATTSSLTIPQEFAIGGMCSFGKSLSLQLDFQKIYMGSIKQWEFDLDPEFYDLVEDNYGIRVDSIREGVDLNFKDTIRIMAGAEFRFKNSIALRAGYTYQKSAIDGQLIHPVFPDLDTRVVSFGVGYDGPTFSVWDTSEKLGGISLDAFFQYAISPKQKSSLAEFPAFYEANQWIVGLGVGITFGSQ